MPLYYIEACSHLKGIFINTQTVHKKKNAVQVSFNVQSNFGLRYRNRKDFLAGAFEQKINPRCFAIFRAKHRIELLFGKFEQKQRKQ